MLPCKLGIEVKQMSKVGTFAAIYQIILTSSTWPHHYNQFVEENSKRNYFHLILCLSGEMEVEKETIKFTFLYIT